MLQRIETTQTSSKRIVEQHFDKNWVSEFLALVKELQSEDLKFLPFKRYVCAGKFRDVFGEELVQTFLQAIQNYETGCVILDFPDDLKVDDYVRIATAFSHLISQPIAEPSGDYFGITSVKHDDNPPFKILDPYRVFSLHTDGVFKDNPVDWLMMMKVSEKEAKGGESRLLHIADFEPFDAFVSEPYGSAVFDFGLEQKDRRYDVFSRVSDMQFGKSRLLDVRYERRKIKFVDQFILPRSIEEADYVDRLQDALESSPSIVMVTLPVGSMVILNNNQWVHGRSAFERNENLERSLLRQYGYFPQHHPYGTE